MSEADSSAPEPRKSGYPPLRPIKSEHLFAAGDEVTIEHQGTRYRLRRTRNGKLILTK
jgi:hemin uptake protein HemP